MRVEFKAVAAFLIATAGCVLWLSQEESLQSHVKEFAMERQNTKQQMTDDRSQMVTLKRSDGEVKIDLEEYLKGVVGSEMTPSFEMEALKAQAVAARTFAASRDYCVDDSTSSQVYLDDSQLKAAWKGNYDANKERIEEAVDATRGEIMVYEGEPITAFFFASSAGKTANSEEYYSSTLPYLRSVESPWDAEVDDDYVSTFSCTKEELAQALSLGQAAEVESVSHYESGYVKDVIINGITFSGRSIREALQLRSSCFSVASQGDMITFTVSGFGHGVGMSQEGAQGMALQGYTYDEILKHYYSGIQLSDVYIS